MQQERKGNPLGRESFYTICSLILCIFYSEISPIEFSGFTLSKYRPQMVTKVEL